MENRYICKRQINISSCISMIKYVGYFNFSKSLHLKICLRHDVKITQSNEVVVKTFENFRVSYCNVCEQNDIYILDYLWRNVI